MQDEINNDDAMASSDSAAIGSNDSAVRMSKSELENLIRARHKAGYEKGRSESASELSSRLASLESRIQTETDPERFNKLIDERAKRMHEEHLQRQRNEQAEQIVGTFIDIMNRGESPNPDREESVRKMNFGHMPQIVKLATEFPDTARHIFHEFDAHPEKLANMLMLANVDENQARAYMRKLSDSISTNINAQVPDIKAPLSQIKPSTNGVGNGKQSIKDLRKQLLSS